MARRAGVAKRAKQLRALLQAPTFDAGLLTTPGLGWEATSLEALDTRDALQANSGRLKRRRSQVFDVPTSGSHAPRERFAPARWRVTAFTSSPRYRRRARKTLRQGLQEACRPPAPMAVTVDFTVKAHGYLGKLELRPDRPEAAVVACLRSHVMQLRFPAPREVEHVQVTLTYGGLQN